MIAMENNTPRQFPTWIVTVLLVLLLVVGSIRIALTYRVYCQTFDETAHITAGLDWFDGDLSSQTEGTPLARIFEAVPLYWRGVRATDHGFDMAQALDDRTYNDKISRALYQGDYQTNLALARTGVLPFFWAAALGVFFWCRRLAGPWVALFAVLLFTILPPVLAHSGLATIDMAVTATFVWAAFVFTIWLETPTLSMSLWLGLTVGLALLSKLSALAF